LTALGRAQGVSRTVAAYSWLMAHPAGSCRSSDRNRPSRIAEGAAALKVRWSRQDWYAVLVAARRRAARGARMPLLPLAPVDKESDMSGQQCEIAWFSALCDDDYEFLGVPDPYLQSSWEHCRNIVLRAEEGGFDNILLPSGYQLGLDTTAFAAAVATQVQADQAAVGDAHGRGLAAATRAPHRHARPHPWSQCCRHRRAAERQHHLVRHARREDRKRPALCAAPPRS
jgi:hypothetical protein